MKNPKSIKMKNPKPIKRKNPKSIKRHPMSFQKLTVK